MTTALNICFTKKGVETLIPYPLEWIGKHLDEILIKPEFNELLVHLLELDDKFSVLLWRKQGDTDWVIRETDEIFIPVHMKMPWQH